MMLDPVKLSILAIVFITFMFVPQISRAMNSSLDTLPVRLGACIFALAVIPYDKYISIGTFLLITAVYIQHHQNDLTGMAKPSHKVLNPYEIPTSTAFLEDGGQADETLEIADYTPKDEDHDNKFSGVGHSQDEKHVLLTEPLGQSKAQAMFGEETKHAEAMANSANRE